MADEIKSLLDLNLLTDESQMDFLRKALDSQAKQADYEIEERNKQIEEYEQLRNRIEELPRKLTQEILVPFGSVGYMKGRIIHTNKVMVSLGDGYFVERSCYEANQMIDRRIAHVKELIEKFKHQKEMVSSEAEFGEQLFKSASNEFEIREPYDEQKELEFKLRRNERKRLKSSREPLPESSFEAPVVSTEDLGDRTGSVTEQKHDETDQRSEELLSTEETKNVGAKPKSIDAKEFAALMEKLDRMEQEEQERNELSSTDDESVLDSDDLPECDIGSGNRSRDEASTSGAVMEIEELAKGKTVVAVEDSRGPCCSIGMISEKVVSPLTPNEMDRVSPPLCTDATARQTASERRKSRRSQRLVRFSTEIECTPSAVDTCGEVSVGEQLENGDAERANSQEKVPEDEPKTIVNDEPRFSCALPRRSILRNSAERSPIDAKAVAEADSRDHRLIVPSSQQAFTGVIRERLVPETPSGSAATPGPAADVAQEQSSQSNPEPGKRISRFKMYRAQLDRPNR